MSEVQRQFASMPALRNVSVRGSGYQMESGAAGVMSSRAAPPLTEDAARASTYPPTDERLHDDADALFLVRFDMKLLARIDEGLTSIKLSIQLFSIVGTLGILIALAITIFAMRTTRRLERNFQVIYQRASLTETAAQLVHDLRNPLAVLRANVKASLV